MRNPGLKEFASFALIVGVSFGVWKSQSQSDSQVNEAVSEKPLGASVKSSVKSRDLASVKDPQSSASTKGGGSKARFQWPPQTKAAIEEFSSLSEKVLSNPEEQMRRSELLMNPDIAQNIGDYLLYTSSEEVQDQDQDQSLDFLVEALKQGSTEALTQVERVIADSQVENDKLPLAQRKFLGETKGELLYQYAALNSVDGRSGSENATERQITALIPGPATQKIWNQVLQELANNFAESKRELAETR